jgi:hypothetical protein
VNSKRQLDKQTKEQQKHKLEERKSKVPGNKLRKPKQR